MGGVRRWAWLGLLSLLVTAAGVAVTPLASASASATPVQMNFACALKSNGLMSYTASPSRCTNNGTAVTIVPGPVYVCVHTDDDNTAFAVASPSKCARPNLLVTLPPTSAPVYFCAAEGSGVLAYTTNPSRCSSSDRFPVVVPVPAPVLANIEPTTLQYFAGTPPVAVTSTLTVSSPETTTLASATVTISSGLATGNYYRSTRTRRCSPCSARRTGATAGSTSACPTSRAGRPCTWARGTCSGSWVASKRTR